MEIEPDTVREEAVEFLRSYVDSAGTEGVVVGLSGGVDSATASAVAVEALGTDGVRGLVLPAGSSDDRNMRDARRHADDFGIPVETVDIGSAVQEIVDLTGVDDREAVGNLRARVRMCVNYMYGNQEEKLVLGTGNRSELLLGYFTKYGDGGVDVSPLGGLYKTEVRELARDLGVHEEVVEKPPTAGLWEGQTDEDEIGAPYETVDRVLRALVDEGRSVEEAAEETGCDVDTVERIEGMYERSEHKRRTPPYPEFGRS